VGFGHSLAIKEDGSLWAWGRNRCGQLGDGRTIDRDVPAEIEILKNVVGVAAGTDYTFAVTEDGSLWGWGYNSNGQLGIGTNNIIEYSPVKVMEDVVSISSSGGSTFAIKKDKSLWAWGSNSFGQLGDGNAYKELPQKVVFDAEPIKPTSTPVITSSASPSNTPKVTGAPDHTTSPEITKTPDVTKTPGHGIISTPVKTPSVPVQPKDTVSKTDNKGSTSTPKPTPTQTSPEPTEIIETPTDKPGVGFSDINEHWAKESIIKLLEKDLITGYEDNTIRPNRHITRNEAIVVLAKLLKLEPRGDIALYFSDKDRIPEWVRPYLGISQNYGLIVGFEDNSFRGQNNLTRAQASVVFLKVLSLTGGIDKSISEISQITREYKIHSNITEYKDFTESHWSYAYLDMAFSIGLIKGYEDKTIRPDNSITRAEFFTMAAKVLEISEAESGN